MNAEQRVAHRIYNAALRSGELVRAESCERCGKGGRIDGHHDDYSKPLNVLWLCPRCHRRRHYETDTAQHGRPRCEVCAYVIYRHQIANEHAVAVKRGGYVHRKCVNRWRGLASKLAQNTRQNVA